MWIRHASQTVRRKADSGERVSNTWVTTPVHGHNQSKDWLIPDGYQERKFLL